jgi:hypothetical protein
MGQQLKHVSVDWAGFGEHLGCMIRCSRQGRRSLKLEKQHLFRQPRGDAIEFHDSSTVWSLLS